MHDSTQRHLHFDFDTSASEVAQLLILAMCLEALLSAACS